MPAKFIEKLLEFLPVIVFFVLFKKYDIYQATIGLVAATLISTAVTYYLQKKVSYMSLFICLITAILGGITIFSKDLTYIKMKPTAVYILFSIVLLVGAYFKKGLIKHIFGSAIDAEEEQWIKFSRKWAYFFLCIAALNEIIWRNFSESFWVNFKVFGILVLTFIFLLTQASFLKSAKK